MKTDNEIEEYNKWLCLSFTSIKKRFVVPLDLILISGNTFCIKKLKKSKR